MEHDLSSDGMADRVNCYVLEPWLAALADHGGVTFNVPLDKGRERVDVSVIRLGLTVTLFRHFDDALPEADQVVFHRLAFDPLRAAMPFGLNQRTLTPDNALILLSEDTVGGRSVDLARGDTRISYFLPEDARVVELTFQPSLLGISACKVFRLGGEIPHKDVIRLFGPHRRGV